MSDLANTIITIGAVITAIAGIIFVYIKVWLYSTKAIKFMMKTIFTMLSILEGAEINGQVEELREKAQIYNIDN